MSYIYIQSEPACWTVGFYDPDGEWQPESDHSKEHLAAERVAYLNGGGDALELRGAIQQLKERVTMLEMSMIDLKTAAAFAPQIEHLRGQMTELETTIAENAAMRQAIAEARAVIEQLPVAVDPFMPPDEFWQWLPAAKSFAVDANGRAFWYDGEIEHTRDEWFVPGTCIDVEIGFCGHRDLGDTDWRTTKRTRPSHL